MINNPIVVSMYRTNPQKCEHDERKIYSGPLYATETLYELAAKAKVIPWSKGAIDDFQKWSFDNEELGQLICEALKRGKYIDSEWCINKPGGSWAACDTYLIHVKEWNEYAHKELANAYYLKIALNKTGQLLLSASNHPEGT